MIRLSVIFLKLSSYLYLFLVRYVAIPFEERIAKLLPPLCISLGGAFPKFGQILSTRADLLGDPIRSSLSTLQDNIPPMSNANLSLLLESTNLRASLDCF